MLLRFDRPRRISLIPAEMPLSWFKDKVGSKYYIQCDGLHDDVFLNEAIESLPKNPGGEIDMRQGTLTITAPIGGAHTGMVFRGAGKERTILDYTAADGSHAITIDSKESIKLEDFTLKGNAAAGHGLRFLRSSMACSKMTLSNMMFRGFGGNLVYADRLFSSLIMGCYFYEGSDDQWMQANQGISNTFINSWFRKIPANKWALNYSGEGPIFQNLNFSASGTSGHGLLLHSSKDFLVSNCNFETMTDGGFALFGKAIQLGETNPQIGKGIIQEASFLNVLTAITLFNLGTTEFTEVRRCRFAGTVPTRIDCNNQVFARLWLDPYFTSNIINVSPNAVITGLGWGEPPRLEPIARSPSVAIAAGVLPTPTHQLQQIDTEGFIANDDLDTLGAGVDGQRVVLRTTAWGRAVTVKSRTGNIYLDNNVDCVLSHVEDRIELQYDDGAGFWVELTRRNNR